VARLPYALKVLFENQLRNGEDEGSGDGGAVGGPLTAHAARRWRQMRLVHSSWAASAFSGTPASAARFRPRLKQPRQARATR
jgi:hypothetical protein